jgi:hypothetical protein
MNESSAMKQNEKSIWPFDDPENVAVISLRSIVFDGKPILHVTHDEDDGSWQFLGKEDARIEDSAVVALKEIVEMDSSIIELHDLPLGWHAWRENPKAVWRRERNQND